ncbi:hypothetical protein BJ742DRAFT_579543 [Cladochytrium replicatum]|nr:hypothetical protein BJ742DRAFT_579543 [Cladochytrium replicatum]
MYGPQSPPEAHNGMSLERTFSAYPVQPNYASPTHPPYTPGRTPFDKAAGSSSANLDSDDWFDIFLSYRHTDSAVVERISDRFKQVGFKVWRDTEGGNMRGDLLSRMRWAIDNSKIVVPVLSRDYCSSDNCKFEFRYAKQNNKVIFPIALVDPFKELRNAPGYADIAVGVESNIFTAMYHPNHSGEFDRAMSSIIGQIRPEIREGHWRPQFRTSGPQAARKKGKSFKISRRVMIFIGVAAILLILGIVLALFVPKLLSSSSNNSSSTSGSTTGGGSGGNSGGNSGGSSGGNNGGGSDIDGTSCSDLNYWCFNNRLFECTNFRWTEMSAGCLGVKGAASALGIQQKCSNGKGSPGRPKNLAGDNICPCSNSGAGACPSTTTSLITIPYCDNGAWVSTGCFNGCTKGGGCN